MILGTMESIRIIWSTNQPDVVDIFGIFSDAGMYISVYICDGLQAKPFKAIIISLYIVCFNEIVADYFIRISLSVYIWYFYSFYIGRY